MSKRKVGRPGLSAASRREVWQEFDAGVPIPVIMAKWGISRRLIYLIKKENEK